MPTKHGVGTPTGLFGCQGSWNRVADSNVAACTAPQGPFPLLPATPRQRQGRAGLPGFPACRNAAQGARSNPMSGWPVWTRHSLSPPRPRSRRTLDGGRASATPGGARWTLPGTACLLFAHRGPPSSQSHLCLCSHRLTNQPEDLRDQRSSSFFNEEMLARRLQPAKGACRVQHRPPQDVPSGRSVILNLREARPCRFQTNSHAPPLIT